MKFERYTLFSIYLSVHRYLSIPSHPERNLLVPSESRTVSASLRWHPNLCPRLKISSSRPSLTKHPPNHSFLIIPNVLSPISSISCSCHASRSCICPFIDRSGIGNAKVARLEKNLVLVGYQFNWALTEFFITYALIEIPSNMVLRFVVPRIWCKQSPRDLLRWRYETAGGKIGGDTSANEEQLPS